jgi:membrane protein DedA with SNARE-associated domain
MASLIQHWGYVAILLGTTFEGEATALSAGALAHQGLFSLPWVALAAFLGTALADQIWFLLGRRFGREFLEKRPKLSRHSARIERFLSQYGSVFVVALRFLYGLRTASVLWLGSSGYDPRRFLVLDTLGAALWTCATLAVGWGLGATLKAALGRPGHVGELLLIACATALITWLVIRVRRRETGVRSAR